MPRRYPKLRGRAKKLAPRYISEEFHTGKYKRKQAIAIGLNRARAEAERERRHPSSTAVKKLSRKYGIKLR